MSWKSLVTAGLLCVLASPVFAVGPTVTIVKGGTQASNNLDDNGNWVWNVLITPDVSMVPDSSGTPVAAELGFTSTNRDILAVANLSTGANDKFDKINPGTAIFPGWQNVPANGLLDTASNNRPTGIQLNAPGVGATAGSSYTTNSSVSGALNQVFAALGSVNFTAIATPQGFIKITVQRPVDGVTPQTSTTISMGGVYGVGSTNGRLTQITGLSGGTYTTSNFDTFASSITRTVSRGDVNMSGGTNADDLNLILTNYNKGAAFSTQCVSPALHACTWYNGDLSGDGTVNSDDLNLILSNYNTTGGVNLGGGLSTGTIPEPASIALLGLALLGGLGVIRRKR